MEARGRRRRRAARMNAKRNRGTVPVGTDISPEMRERLRADAARMRYPTFRAYLEALIEQGLVDGLPADEQLESLGTTYPSSSWALGPTILGNRLVRAVEALTERIHGGEDMGALRTDLMSLRREVVAHLLTLRADYDREVQVRDARHYARFGTVDE
jgi:hypothetical protein